MSEPQHNTRRAEGKRAVIAGLALFACSMLLALLPLVWGRSSINKYFVAFGLLGLCAAVGFIAHGAWDWWRDR